MNVDYIIVLSEPNSSWLDYEQICSIAFDGFIILSIGQALPTELNGIESEYQLKSAQSKT